MDFDAFYGAFPPKAKMQNNFIFRKGEWHSRFSTPWQGQHGRSRMARCRVDNCRLLGASYYFTMVGNTIFAAFYSMGKKFTRAPGRIVEAMWRSNLPTPPPVGEEIKYRGVVGAETGYNAKRVDQGGGGLNSEWRRDCDLEVADRGEIGTGHARRAIPQPCLFLLGIAPVVCAANWVAQSPKFFSTSESPSGCVKSRGPTGKE